MGFDVYGLKAKSKKGEYFRNSVWWWRRLWQFVSLYCKDILSEEEIQRGSYNDCYHYNEEKATAIAKRIYEKIEDGTAKKYSMEIRKMIRIAKKENSKLTNKQIMQHNWDEDYPFTIKNLREFAEFADKSGGFEIC